MAEPDNLVLLREMRADMDRRHEELVARMDSEFAAVNKRLDAMHQNGIKALKGFIGHRAMAERAMASFDVDMSELKRRVTALEAARA